MTQPMHHIGDRVHFVSGRDHGAVNHDHGHAAFTRGDDLGCGARPSGIFRHYKFDPVFAHQSTVALYIKRAAIDHDMTGGKSERLIRRIHQPQKIEMLRDGSKVSQMHAPDRQHDTGWGPVERRHRSRNVRDPGPEVRRLGHPWGPSQGHERDVALRAGRDGIGAHLGRKRVRGVDHMCDGFAAQMFSQSRNAPKATHALRQRLAAGMRNAPGERNCRRQTRFCHALAQSAGFARSSEDQQVEIHV